jgi:hypothetical protein
MRDLNWPGILFGAGAGVASSLLLFAVVFGLGSNIAVQVPILMVSFFVAGYVSGHYALTEPRMSGGFAALVMLFVIVGFSISARGDGVNLIGLAVLGVGAALLGPAGGAVGYNRRKP